MTEKNPSQSAMEKIMQGEVKQLPKWHFVVKNVVLWSVGILCMFAGALTVGMIIFTFANGAFSLRNIVNNTFGQHVMIVFPFLWVVIMAAFIALFDLFVRHTKRGYRYSLPVIIAINVGLSIILGTLFYFFGISHAIDDVLGGRFNHYHSVEKRQARLFNNPDKGVIIGRTLTSADDHFILVTHAGDQWYVISGYMPPQKKRMITKGQRVLVVGKKIDNDVFVACDVHNRGMVGANPRVRYKRMMDMQRINRANFENCPYKETNSDAHIESMVKTACEHIDMQMKEKER